MLAIYNINLVMIKEAIVPANETVVDQPDKTSNYHFIFNNKARGIHL